MDVLDFLARMVSREHNECIYGAPIGEKTPVVGGDALLARPRFAFAGNGHTTLGTWRDSLADGQNPVDDPLCFFDMIDKVQLAFHWPKAALGPISRSYADQYAKPIWAFFEVLRYFTKHQSTQPVVRTMAELRFEQVSREFAARFASNAINGFSIVMYLMLLRIEEVRQQSIVKVWFSEVERRRLTRANLGAFSHFLSHWCKAAQHKTYADNRERWFGFARSGESIGSIPPHFRAGEFEFAGKDHMGFKARGYICAADANWKMLNSLDLTEAELESAFGALPGGSGAEGVFSSMSSNLMQPGEPNMKPEIPFWAKATEEKLAKRRAGNARFLDTERLGASTQAVTYAISRDDCDKGMARVVVPFDEQRLPAEAWEFRPYIVLNPGANQSIVPCECVGDEYLGSGLVKLTLEFSDRGDIHGCNVLRTESGNGLSVHTLDDVAEVQLRIEGFGF